MNKLLPLLLFITTLFISSCKDDNISSFDPPNFEDKLAGTWNLDRVVYDTKIPDFTGGSGTTPVHGEGSDVEGSIVLTQDPNNFTYDFNFSASLSGFEVPVNQSGEGTWTTTRDNSKVIVTAENGEEIVFEVIVNEEKKQVYKTRVTQSLQGIFTLEVDMELEFSRP